METSGAHVLQWEMYGPGTAVAFCAIAEEHGFRVILERDRASVLTGTAGDTETLIRMSQELRSQLQQLGYAPKPLAARTALLGGGPCWGPAAPLDSRLIQSLR
jgi:hypothetical protein